jgi:hypothetical protein
LSGMRKHALSDLLPKPRSPAEALRVCPATSQPRQSSSNRGSAGADIDLETKSDGEQAARSIGNR